MKSRDNIPRAEISRPIADETIKIIFVRLPVRLSSETRIRQPLGMFRGMAESPPLAVIKHGNNTPFVFTPASISSMRRRMGVAGDETTGRARMRDAYRRASLATRASLAKDLAELEALAGEGLEER